MGQKYFGKHHSRKRDAGAISLAGGRGLAALASSGVSR